MIVFRCTGERKNRLVLPNLPDLNVVVVPQYRDLVLAVSIEISEDKLLNSLFAVLAEDEREFFFVGEGEFVGDDDLARVDFSVGTGEGEAAVEGGGELELFALPPPAYSFHRK